MAVVVFCALSDAFLITIGVAGLSWIIQDVAAQYAPWLFGVAACWLTFYGGQRLLDAWRGQSALQAATAQAQSLGATLGVAALLTFGNPHVYLDTVVLLGTLSVQFAGLDKVAIGAGAALASLLFFSLLALGASALSPLMSTPRSWRIIDTVIAVVLLGLAISMLRMGGLLGA
jgi:L-lysine exporter family protein LysE/ArgO